jgi:tRNA threonylcarbamoyladenosine biosynthesis protein TsaB
VPSATISFDCLRTANEICLVKILALETSTEYCSVALLLGGQCLTREVRAGQRHSELLLPMVDEVLAEGGVTLRTLDAIAFGEGPGSFTGLRIACGVAQGLALGADLPVAGVSTLAALAQAAASPQVIACLDARMGEVYCATYRCDQVDWARRSAVTLCNPGDVPVPEGSGWVGCGSGFDAFADVLRERYRGHMERVVPGLFPHAREVALLAVSVVAAGLAVAPEHAIPVYVRDKVALKSAER